MSMIYADSREARDAMYEIAPGFGQDAYQIFRDLAFELGTRDPIAHYEPGKTLEEVWVKYRDAVPHYKGRIELLASPNRARELRAYIPPLENLVAGLSRAFAPGAKPGERDRERLAELVHEVRKLRKLIHDAEGIYGTRAPTPKSDQPLTRPVPEPIPEKKIVKSEFPIWLVLAGLALFLLPK